MKSIKIVLNKRSVETFTELIIDIATMEIGETRNYELKEAPTQEEVGSARVGVSMNITDCSYDIDVKGLKVTVRCYSDPEWEEMRANPLDQ